jgi:hypothetical protein
MPMPKRSLHPGNGDTKKIEQLNQAVEKMLARTDGKVGKAAAEIEPLVRIAGGRLKGFTVTRWSDFPEADFWP